MPSDITTEAWYDADDASTITESGGAVSQWDDKSGNGHNLAQATGAEQPVLTASTINDLPSLCFDHLSQQSMQRSGANVTAGMIVGVAIATSDSPELSTLISADADDTLIRQWTLGSQLYRLSNPDTNEFNYNDGAYYINGAVTDVITYGQPHILSVEKGSLSGGAFPTISLGRATALSRFWDGYIGEPIMLSDNSDRQKIEGYLAWKWGFVS